MRVAVKVEFMLGSMEWQGDYPSVWDALEDAHDRVARKTADAPDPFKVEAKRVVPVVRIGDEDDRLG